MNFIKEFKPNYLKPKAYKSEARIENKKSKWFPW